MNRLLAGILVALACVTLSPRNLRADEDPHLTRALKLIEDLDYAGALGELEAALASGSNNAYELQLIYRLTGEVHGAYGRPADAEKAFRALLVLDPAATLADGRAPKIIAPFERAQEWVENNGTLAVRFEHSVQNNEHAFTLVNERDPLKMVAGVRAAYVQRNGGSRRVGSTAARPTLVLLPGKVTGEVALYAVDKWGNELLTEVIELDGAVAPMVTDDEATDSGDDGGADAAAPGPSGSGSGSDPAPERRRRSRSFLGHWAVWGGLAVGAAAAGTYFHVSAQGDQQELVDVVNDSENHEYSEARELQSRTNRKLMWSQVSFGAGAALAVTSVVLLVRDVVRDDDEPAPRRRVELVGGVGRGGGTVGVRVAF